MGAFTPLSRESRAYHIFLNAQSEKNPLEYLKQMVIRDNDHLFGQLKVQLCTFWEIPEEFMQWVVDNNWEDAMIELCFNSKTPKKLFGALARRSSRCAQVLLDRHGCPEKIVEDIYRMWANDIPTYMFVYAPQCPKWIKTALSMGNL